MSSARQRLRDNILKRGALSFVLVWGVLFFGGLWWTVCKGVASESPAAWFFGSLVLRMGIALGGFCLVGNGDWERLILCLAGFVVARLAVTRLTRPAPEASYAP